MKAFIVEGDQRIVQNQRDALVGGQHHVAYRQPYRKIQLIRRALAEQTDAAPHGVARHLGGEGQVAAQQHLVIPPARDGGEYLRRPRTQRGGETVLQHGVGL